MLSELGHSFMKTFANPQDKAEILRRLESIRPTSPRQWGKMSAHQMICHLTDSFRATMGDKAVSRMPGVYPRTLFKWMALYVPMSWPHGFKTRPEMDQQIGGTPPAEFNADLQELRGIIERFAASFRDGQGQPHPVFGRMSHRDGMRWGYLHSDHHLRQFGA